MTLNLTSGGIDKGARPICDGRHVEAENGREETIGKAGSRKAGKETDEEAEIALSSPLDRVVENIASTSSSCLDVKVRALDIFGFPVQASAPHVTQRERTPVRTFLSCLQVKPRFPEQKITTDIVHYTMLNLIRGVGIHRNLGSISITMSSQGS
jgi:hypothetical protein